MQYETIIGVDPGVNGAIAFKYTTTGAIEVIRIPKIVIKKGKRSKGYIDIAELKQQISKHVLKPAIAYIEDVHAMPKQGVSSTFSFGESKGILEGLFLGMDIGIRLVAPNRWKAAMKVGNEKNKALMQVKLLFPQLQIKTDDEAEAILIALYGYEQYKSRSDSYCSTDDGS